MASSESGLAARNAINFRAAVECRPASTSPRASAIACRARRSFQHLQPPQSDAPPTDQQRDQAPSPRTVAHSRLLAVIVSPYFNAFASVNQYVATVPSVATRVAVRVP